MVVRNVAADTAISSPKMVVTAPVSWWWQGVNGLVRLRIAEM